MFIHRFLLCLLLSVGALVPAWAQNMTKKQSNQLSITTTYVELSGFPEFDAAFKAAIQRYWTATPFQFTTPDALEKIVSDEAISMLRIVETHGSRASIITEYTYLAVLLGGKNKMSRYTTDDIIGRARFWASGVEQYVKETDYRVDFLVKELNDQLLRKREEYAGQKPGPKENPALLKSKTLLVPKEPLAAQVSAPVTNKKMDAFTLDAWEGYQSAYKILPLADIKIILADTSSANASYCLFLPQVGIYRTFNIYDLETRKLIYEFWVGNNKTNPPITKKDLAKLSQAVAGKK